MISLLNTANGNVRVSWQGFEYELGPALARLNALKLIELGSLPGRGAVKMKFQMLSKGGAEYRVDWNGTKDQALAFAASLGLCAGEAERQRIAIKAAQDAAEERARGARIARYDAPGRGR